MTVNLNQELQEFMQVQAAIIPVSLDAAANNGDWVSMKNYARLAIVFFKAAGTAGDDPVLTVRQATDVSGTSAKALNFTKVAYKVGTQTSLGTFSTATQDAANTYTDAASAEAQGIFIINIKPSDLDVANGFDCVQFQVPDVGSNAQIGCALYLLWGAKYAPPLTAITD